MRTMTIVTSRADHPVFDDGAVVTHNNGDVSDDGDYEFVGNAI